MNGFQHVLIAKHRPQSNGIAERFVRTGGEWLADSTFPSEEELIALLAEFREYYNDRPHQGIAMPGLRETNMQNEYGVILMMGAVVEIYFTMFLTTINLLYFPFFVQFLIIMTFIFIFCPKSK